MPFSWFNVVYVLLILIFQFWTLLDISRSTLPLTSITTGGHKQPMVYHFQPIRHNVISLLFLHIKNPNLTFHSDFPVFYAYSAAYKTSATSIFAYWGVGFSSNHILLQNMLALRYSP